MRFADLRKHKQKPGDLMPESIGSQKLRAKYTPAVMAGLEPSPGSARVWCDAISTGGHCQLAVDHPGPHVYAARKR